MAEESDAEKTEQPSQHRLDEFRKRGEVASSKELNSILILSATILTLSICGAYIYELFADMIRYVYALDVDAAFEEKALKTILIKTLVTGMKAAAPAVLTTMCMGVIAQMAQVGFLYAPEALEWKGDRLNPINGIKRLVSIKALVETIKSIMKFIIVLGIAYYFLKKDLLSYSGFLHVDFVDGFAMNNKMILKLIYSILLGLSVVAIGDFTYEKFTYHKKLMLTKQEAKQEHKEQEGNPEIKQRIRSIQKQMSQKRMMNDVKKADVIVTNPTHLSVAIQYDKSNMVSPKVVAKGADFLALRIRELAKDNDIPVVENIQLARTLYKTVKVNTYIPRELYKTIAEVLAFVYKLKKKKKALS
jgi:flagellar biosynthetic protein FlhB